MHVRTAYMACETDLRGTPTNQVILRHPEPPRVEKTSRTSLCFPHGVTNLPPSRVAPTRLGSDSISGAELNTPVKLQPGVEQRVQTWLRSPGTEPGTLIRGRVGVHEDEEEGEKEKEEEGEEEGREGGLKRW
jgi:hypothetical protein